MTYCPSCGVKGLPEARFCVNCGAPLTAPSATPQPPVTTPSATVPTLTADQPPTTAFDDQSVAATSPRVRLTRPPARRRRTVIAAVVTVVVILVGAGGWVLARAVPAIGNLVGMAPSALAAPATLAGGWITQTAFEKSSSDPQAATKFDAVYQHGRDVDAANISSAFHGAAAVVQDYMSSQGDITLRIRAVRAQAPTYWAHKADTLTTEVGVILPRQQVVNVGPVVCLVRHLDIASATAETADNTVSECMRTSPNLTVWSRPVSLLPADAAAIVESAWAGFDGPNGNTPTWPTDNTATTPLQAPTSFSGGTFTSLTNASQQPIAARYTAESQADGLTVRSVYGGAAAYSATYTDAALTHAFTMSVVRAWSPLPYVQYVDPSQSKQLAPGWQRLTVGDVSCEVFNNSVPADGNPADLQPKAQSCMRSGANLTVSIDRMGDDLAGDLPAVAALVDEAWAAANTK